MKTIALTATLSAVALLTACGPDCTDPDVKVTLSASTEDVRALPVIPSGKLRLLDLDVPESHGRIEVKLAIEGADSVSIDSLEFTETINGTAKELERTRTQLNDADFADTDVASSGDALRFFWRTTQLGDLGLTEGQPHAAKVTVNWRKSGCRTQTGAAELEIPGVIRTPNTQKNFVLQTAEAGRLQTIGGIQAKLSLKSNVPNDMLQNITNPNYTVTFFSQGLPPIIGYGFADKTKVSRQVGGVPKGTLSAAETLDVFTSTNPSIGNAPYEHSGVAAATQALVGGGRAVVTLRIDAERANSTTGAFTEVINVLVDVP